MLSVREKLILAGLYLSKYDTVGLKKLGFGGFTEAFNVIGYALGSKPASVNNYRDEFDPLFPNPRRGWHKRATRDYCPRLLKQYEGLDFEAFSWLIKSFLVQPSSAPADSGLIDGSDGAESAFARRVMTGLAAEHYFERVCAGIPEFCQHDLENTTQLGCGYDFRLRCNLDPFLAVEVKGLSGLTGSVTLTAKEYEAASQLKNRYYLFVVKNFQKAPCHEIFPDPVSGKLTFRRAERVVVQVSWLVNL